MAKPFDAALTWGQRLASGWAIFKSAFFQFYIWPTVSAMLTGATGYLGGIPLMWIIVAVAVVFMCVAQSFLRIHEIMERMNPRNKLAYVQTVAHVDFKGGNQLVAPPQAGRPRKILRMQLGVELQNRCSFPISLIVANAESEIEGLFPPRTSYPKPAVTILPGGLVRCIDSPIEMKDKPCGRLTAKMAIKVKYGMQGDEVEELNFNAVLDIIFSPDGTLTQLMTNWSPTTPVQGPLAAVTAA
jgi:hypothetical protein